MEGCWGQGIRSAASRAWRAPTSRSHASEVRRAHPSFQRCGSPRPAPPHPALTSLPLPLVLQLLLLLFHAEGLLPRHGPDRPPPSSRRLNRLPSRGGRAAGPALLKGRGRAVTSAGGPTGAPRSPAGGCGEESPPLGARREGVGVCTRGTPRHREGAPAARRRRAWEARSLRHGRYHRALGGGTLGRTTWRAGKKLPRTWGPGQSYHRGEGGRPPGPRFLVEGEEAPVRS